MLRVIAEQKHPIKVWASDLEAEAGQQLRRLADLPFIYKHVAVMPDAHAGRGSTVGTVIATKGAIIPAAVGVDIGCGMSALKLPFQAEALGGGNHFIEVCVDEEGGAWIMLHSGSRNIGKCLAEIHIDRAKGLMREYFIDLPDPDLAYLAQGTNEFKLYLHDLMWAQKFAMYNREEMMDRALREVLYHVGRLAEYNTIKDAAFRVNCHHNYTAIEHHHGKNVYITRKGAVSAREGEWGIIPGSMGTRSYIVKGKGSLDSFMSCSHGAGRRMSRTRARATFTIADLEAQTAGVECLKSSSVLDEIPASYKDIDVVMANQADLVTPVHTLKQLICIKGA